MRFPAPIERLLALLRKRSLDGELDGEVLAHLEMAERDAIASGMSPEEARRAARRHFGGIEQMKEEHRDRRSFRWMETLVRDFRYGLASVARNPGFTAIVVGVLALGIGANTAMFSLVDAVLLKPLPFPEPDRIVRVWEVPRPGASNSTSTLDFLDWQRFNTVFEALSAETPISAALTGIGEPARLDGSLVSADYFRVFGVSDITGRPFTPEEDQAGADPVVVLSHAAWQTYFGGDPDILDRRPMLDGVPHQVVGVLPPGPFDRGRGEFWKPIAFTPEQRTRDFHWLSVIGRLRSGVTIEQARAEMARVRKGLMDVTPVWKQDWTVTVEPLDRLLVGENLRQSLVVALGAVGLVLLIACANVANLLLARGASRRKEMAVRAALGAGRSRLAAQLLTECSVLCLLGGAAGVAVAYFLIRVASPFLPELLPYTASVSLDLRVFAFAAAVALGVALLVGALPSVQISYARLSQSMNQSSRGSSGSGASLRRAIVIGEVALSLVLLCGALLLLRSLFNLQQVETGIRIDGIVTASANLPAAGYPTPERAALFYDAVVERIEAVPGVDEAALTTHLPLQWIGHGEGLFVPGVDETINVRFKLVDPGYFETLDIPVLAGRGVEDSDRAGAPGVIIINEVLAARLADVAGLPNPIGRPVRLTCPAYVAKEGVIKDVEIVGIIRNERVGSLTSSDPPVVYVPFSQVPWPDVRFIVRTQGDPASLVPDIRAAVREVDTNLPLGDIATMQHVRDSTLSGASRPAWLIGAFAVVATLLAALGLYGVLAHAVAQRRREIGIRMALGARSRDVLSHVLAIAVRMIAIGLILGLAGAVALTRVMGGILFQVSALDPVALIVGCISMALVGLAAGFVPAQTATCVDPVTVLREEG